MTTKTMTINTRTINTRTTNTRATNTRATNTRTRTGACDADPSRFPAATGSSVTSPPVVASGRRQGHVLDDPARYRRAGTLLPPVAWHPDVTRRRGRSAGAGGRHDTCVGYRPAPPSATAIAWPTFDVDASPAVAGAAVPLADHGASADMAATGSPHRTAAGRRHPALREPQWALAVGERYASGSMAADPAVGAVRAVDAVAAFPALAVLTGGWTWWRWSLPGPAANTTLVGEAVCGGVMVTVFVQTDRAASARWTSVHDQCELGVVQGSVAEVVAGIEADEP